jgi:hypothetical protein
MKTFNITLQRTVEQIIDLEIEAENEKDAERLALLEADDPTSIEYWDLDEVGDARIIDTYEVD